MKLPNELRGPARSWAKNLIDNLGASCSKSMEKDNRETKI